MCGFTGILFAEKQRQVDPAILKEMSSVIRHRGPDDEGFHIEGNVGLGFRRLSIIDLQLGHQPMSDVNERAWIVFNGEIYNYPELQSRLIDLGYKFKTHSDTEVLLNAYLEYGNQFVKHLRGMFAFAIWDVKKRKLLLGRDRFGIKPLYYALDSKRLAFGSEMKTILRGGFTAKELDWQAVDSFFSYGYILSPLSIYKDIRKLPPGHTLEITTGEKGLEATLEQYWKPEFKPDFSISFDDYKILLREKLAESVKAHIISDVPVGAFLSGGIDSNAVVSAMTKVYPEKVKTFSIGFEDDQYNEAFLAAKSAAVYGTDHTELYLKPESAEIIDDIVDFFDEPFADSSAVPTYFVSKLASEQVKVVLSGDGGDEFFAGYTMYQRLQKIHRYRGLIRASRFVSRGISNAMPFSMKGKRFLYSLSKDPEHIYAYTMQFNEIEKGILFNKELSGKLRENQSASIKKNLLDQHSEEYISKLLKLDISTLMVDDILTKVDRASMANSLEVRVPIIDHTFFELASSIPVDMKLQGEMGKYIFREAVKDTIPDYIYNKPKTGFTIPVHKWFAGNLIDFAHETMKEAHHSGFFNPAYLEPYMNKSNLGGQITRIWYILIFTRWLDRIHKS